MDLFETIDRRHSYRGSFKNEPIPRDMLRQIVETGLKAPSGCNAQTTRFIVLDDPDLVRRIRELPGANTALQQAAAYIACIVDENPAGVYQGLSFQVEDCAAAVENMLLAVTASGYASVWIDGWLRKENRAAGIGRLIGLPPGKTIRVLLPLGRPVDPPRPPEKLPFEQRAWFNRYPA